MPNLQNFLSAASEKIKLEKISYCPLERSFPQKRQITASLLIDSAQYGHFLFLLFDCFNRNITPYRKRTGMTQVNSIMINSVGPNLINSPLNRLLIYIFFSNSSCCCEVRLYRRKSLFEVEITLYNAYEALGAFITHQTNTSLCYKQVADGRSIREPFHPVKTYPSRMLRPYARSQVKETSYPLGRETF